MTSVCGLARKRLLAIGDQELVEIGIRADDRHVPGRGRKRDAVDGCAKLDVAAEKLGEFGTSVFPAMDELYAGGSSSRRPVSCRHIRTSTAMMNSI